MTQTSNSADWNQVASTFNKTRKKFEISSMFESFLNTDNQVLTHVKQSALDILSEQQINHQTRSQ